MCGILVVSRPTACESEFHLVQGGERNGLGRREKRPKKIGKREEGESLMKYIMDLLRGKYALGPPLQTSQFVGQSFATLLKLPRRK